MNENAVAKPATIVVPDSCVVQTPYILADAMVKSLGLKESDRWLEPCVGNGALLGAMARAGIARRNIFGLDVNANPRPNDRFGTVSRGTEFLRWSNETSSRFDKIIANPPYVALERLSSEIRSAALNASYSDQVQISGNANAWFAFLCAAIRLLNYRGSLCFLLPAAWDYANYAESLRRNISRQFASVKVWRTRTPIFRASNVEEGAVVLLAEGRLAEKSRRSKVGAAFRSELSSMAELVEALYEHRTVSSKTAVVTSPAVVIKRNAKVVGETIVLRLGTVTGDSQFFLLSETRRLELRLPEASLVPVVSKAKHLRWGRIGLREWSSLRAEGERVWLFRPSQNVARNKSVKTYIQFGLNGGCKIGNHKITIRDPWYLCPNEPNCDGFISGMSSYMPAITLRSMTDLSASNTLYKVFFKSQKLSSQERLAFSLSLLTSQARESLAGLARSYAAGLLKHEPSDILKAQVPDMKSRLVTWVDYKKAFQALQQGDDTASRRIADLYVE